METIFRFKTINTFTQFVFLPKKPVHSTLVNSYASIVFFFGKFTAFKTPNPLRLSFFSGYAIFKWFLLQFILITRHVAQYYN